MLDCLPQTIEPVGLADAGRSFRGEVALGALRRLAPLLTDTDGVLRVQLTFRLDERRLRILEGGVDGEIRLQCQRCLEPLVFALQLKFRLGIVTDEAGMERLPEGYEPLLVTGEPLDTAEVIEDEVLLAIPAVPVHGGGERCESGYRNQALPEKDNPFAVLEKLKS